MSTLVYRYGLLAPIEHADVVREQMRIAHSYRNTLVEIERGRRAAARALMSKSGNVSKLEIAVANADAALEKALRVVKTARASTRSRSETAEQTAAIKAARLAKKEAVGALRLRRKAIRDDGRITDASKALYAKAADLGKNAYKYTALYWGTRTLIDEAMEAVRKAPLYDGAEANDPCFLRWEGEGRLGLQVHQKGEGGAGFTVDEVHACSGNAGDWLAIEKPTGDGASRRSGQRTILQMRVGTAEDRSPMMAKWPMVMHRPLPPGAIVRRVAVSLRRRGPREEWSVEMTIDTKMVKPLKAAPKGSGSVAVDIGWHSVLGGLRVATWVDERGEAGELILSDAPAIKPKDRRQNRKSGAGELSSLQKHESLASIRSKNFDAARDALSQWLLGATKIETSATIRKGTSTPVKSKARPKRPEWLTIATATLDQWRSPGRLAALALRWRSNRFKGDEQAYGALENWRYNDHHLWAWQESQRVSGIRRRKDVYRNFAASLASKYERVIISDVDYSKIARRPAPDADPSIKAADRSRQLAAPGELRLILEQAFIARQAKPERIPAADLATKCPECGSTEQVQKDTKSHKFACINCTFSHDADKATCLNMLRAGGAEKAVNGIIARAKKAVTAIRGKRRNPPPIAAE